MGESIKNRRPEWVIHSGLLIFVFLGVTICPGDLIRLKKYMLKDQRGKVNG